MTENSITPLKVAVIYGGQSSEHEISLLSARSVVAHLDRSRYQIIPISISKEGVYYRHILEEIFDPEQPALSLQGLHSERLSALPFDTLDVIFPMMHGALYEDGCFQGLLQLGGKPFVGAGVLSSAVGMDKALLKQIAQMQDIPCLPQVVFTLSMWRSQPKECLASIHAELSYPLFVKPSGQGSSVGVSRVTEDKSLISAIEQALMYDHKVIVEQGIAARDVEIAVMENDERPHQPFLSPCGEIIFDKKYDFYTYEAKYHDPDHLQLVIPALLTEAQQHDLRTYAARIFFALNGEGYARVDFLIDKDSGKVYFNELNTIPGFTTMSMFPLMWQQGGLHYSELLDKLIVLACRRHERQQKLNREWHR